MGLVQNSDKATISARLAPFAARNDMDASILDQAAALWQASRSSEVFDRRQPEHVILSSLIGLGVFDPRAIEHRRIQLA
jgi:hypothetical protein